MYIDALALQDFRAIARSRVLFVHPAAEISSQVELPNLNVLLGTNGGGKSSVLKAIASAMTIGTDGSLPDGAERWPRIGGTNDMSVELSLVSPGPGADAGDRPVVAQRTSGSYRMSRATPRNVDVSGLPVTTFIAAYGPARTKTTGEPGDAVAGLHLLDESIPLVELAEWYLDAAHGEMIAKILNAVLPNDVQCLGREHQGGRLFAQRGIPLLTEQLSDGIRSFLAWIGDFFWRIERSAPATPLDEVEGLLLVDEVDQRLHPAWAQSVLTRLASCLPAVQMICTATSPLIPSGLRRPNIALVEPDPDLVHEGATLVRHLATEEVYGRTADQVLTSSYFGMASTRGDRFRTELRALAVKAQRPDGRDAAVEFMRRLADPTAGDAGPAS